MSTEKEKKEDKKSRKPNGQFAKGHEKRGGRKLGTKNRAGNVRDRLKEFLEPFIDNIEEYLTMVKREEGTKEMLTLVEKFMPYCWPKYSAMSLSADQDRPITEEQRLVELEQKYTKKMLQIDIKSMVVVDNDRPRDVDIDPDEDPDFDLSQFEGAEELPK